MFFCISNANACVDHYGLQQQDNGLELLYACMQSNVKITVVIYFSNSVVRLLATYVRRSANLGLSTGFYFTPIIGVGIIC